MQNCFAFTVNVILKRCDFLFLNYCYALHMKYMRGRAQQAYAWNWKFTKKHITGDEWTFVWEQRATNLKIWVGWRQKHAIITKLYFSFAFVTTGVSKSFFKLCMRLLLLFATQVVQRKHLTKCISFTHQLYTTYLLVWHNYISL